MTYDFHGGFDQGSTGSNFMAAMTLDPKNDPTYSNPILSKYNVTDAMDTYVQQGISKSKLLVGIPIYGRMINIDKQGSTYGLYQSITGVPQGEWDNSQSGFTGFLNYNCIVDQSSCGNQYKLPNLTLVNPNTNEYGKYAHTPWAYADNLFITYEDNQSAGYKTQWLLDQGFAGVILWDLSGDFSAQDSRSIVNSVYQKIQALPSKKKK
jgi:chitinase